MKKLNLITLGLLAALLTACNGGGGSTDATPQPKAPSLPMGVSVKADYSAGTWESGDIIDARPFASTTRFVVTFTNPYDTSMLFAPSGIYASSPDFTDGVLESDGSVSYKGWAASASLSSAASEENNCYDYSSGTAKLKELAPRASCKATYYMNDIFNYSDTESLYINITYQYRSKAYAFVEKKTPAIPVKAGITYMNGLGYNFNNQNQGIEILANTESGQDYLYVTNFINSSQKVKVSYDQNGVAFLDYPNNVVTCTNPGCTNGNVPLNVAFVYPYAPYEVVGMSFPYGDNDLVYGLNEHLYGKGGNGGRFVNILNQITAVQPDGTILAYSLIEKAWGCFNNDGSNFRPVVIDANYKNVPESQMIGGNFQNYYHYKNTNWVDTGFGFSYAGSVQGRLIASNDGTCILTQDGGLNTGLVGKWVQGGRNTTSQTLQITNNGVFGIYETQYPNVGLPYYNLKFYKYPPQTN